MIAFTICSNNYLPYAKVLCESLKKFHQIGILWLGLLIDLVQDWYEIVGFDVVIPVEEIKCQFSSHG